MAQPTQSVKRNITMVDPDNTNLVVQSSKKLRALPDPDRKKNCPKFILDAYNKLKVHAKDLDLTGTDIVISCQLTNILFAGYTINRQRAAGRKGNVDNNQTKKNSR